MIDSDFLINLGVFLLEMLQYGNARLCKISAVMVKMHRNIQLRRILYSTREEVQTIRTFRGRQSSELFQDPLVFIAFGQHNWQ